MIWWDGKSSDDFHVIVERLPTRPVPRRKGSFQSVAGRNGDLVDQEDAWENVIQPYEVYLSGEFNGGMPWVADQAVAWLMAKGYRRLEDSYDRRCFRLAAFMGDVSILNTLNEFGRCTIEFNCKPQRFLYEGAEARSVASGTVLINPTPYTARPLIVVRGSGAGSLTVGSRTMSLANCNNVTIDCENEDVYKNTTNLNNAASGPFPLLEPGESAITWEGGITSVRLTPRWFVL